MRAVMLKLSHLEKLPQNHPVHMKPHSLLSSLAFVFSFILLGGVTQTTVARQATSTEVNSTENADNTEDEDIVIADFESESYSPWTTTGTAFGSGPARGTLPNQMQVSRFGGQGLVNSFAGGDDSTGTLESPPFEITKPHLNFLIGGGGWDETTVTLVVDGQVVREARGPNTQSGGAETLTWHSWDVSELDGENASIRIIDQRKGGWGHILADHFVLSDEPRLAKSITRSIAVDGKYLHLPVKTGAPKVWVRLMDGDQQVRRFEIELVSEAPGFIAAADVQPWKGKVLEIVVDDTFAENSLLQGISTGDQLPAAEEIFTEDLRPAFHFTSKIGWLNDPNGLVYYAGQWHLFYQHNPFGWNWGNMHWGHATSVDLLHWVERGDKIHPWSDAVGAAFSGSGLVDADNTSGLGEGDGELMVFPFTDTAIGESLAYSNDGGRTLKIFEGNPVVKHQGRDPKVIWHKPTQRWVMAVYTEAEGKQWIAFHTSKNLIDWKYESRIEGFYECPDLFKLPILAQADGEAPSGKTMWVLYAADGKYVLGEFDGREFQPNHNGKYQVWHGDFYAAQTYSNAPEQRRNQIGWGRGVQFPGQRFNQQMVVPVELMLRDTKVGVRMFAEPVKELRAYADPLDQWRSVSVSAEPLELVNREAPWQLDLTLEIEDSAVARLDIGGAVIEIDRDKHEVRLAELTAAYRLGGAVRLRVLVDRGSVELFVDDGALAFSKAWLFGRKPVKGTMSSETGGVRVRTGEVSELKIDRM